MRAIHLTKRQFDEVFYGVLTNGHSTPQDEQGHEVALRLIRQLKDLDVTYPESPKPKVLAAVEESGQRWWPNYKLKNGDHVFEFEEDVYRVVEERFRAFIPHVHPMMQEEFDDVWQLVKGAEQYDASKVEDEQAPELQSTG